MLLLKKSNKDEQLIKSLLVICQCHIQYNNSQSKKDLLLKRRDLNILYLHFVVHLTVTPSNRIKTIATANWG